MGGPAPLAHRNLARVTVAGMAGHAKVSQRTLNRQFRARTSRSPQERIQRERLQVTQELLESTP
jgi:transcriptional regulator GlxA family with amidase domain